MPHWPRRPRASKTLAMKRIKEIANLEAEIQTNPIKKQSLSHTKKDRECNLRDIINKAREEVRARTMAKVASLKNEKARQKQLEQPEQPEQQPPLAVTIENDLYSESKMTQLLKTILMVIFIITILYYVGLYVLFTSNFGMSFIKLILKSIVLGVVLDLLF